MTQSAALPTTGTGAHTYTWLDSWAEVPSPEAAATGWAHPGMATTSDGLIVTCHPGLPLLMFLRPDGSLARSFRLDVTEAHGIACSGVGGTERLWVADSGGKRLPGPGYPAHSAEGGGQVLELALDGTVLRRLEKPDLPNYTEGKFSPTNVAVDDERLGGTGDVWVADGYGQSLVHRYRKDGTYVSSISGAEGEAGAFKTPDSVIVDRRKGEPELYVADRANRRLQVYDLDGRWKRAIGSPDGDVLSSPSAFAMAGDLLAVAELRARLALLDPQDRVVAYLGANEAACDQPGWPNRKDAAGEPIRPGDLTPGLFNSPHGVTATADGPIYVAEWLIGGRYTKLVPGG
jgi:hypothetical protein